MTSRDSRNAETGPLAFLLILLSGVWLTASYADGVPAHYLVFEIDQEDLVEPVFSRLVVLSELPPSKTDEELEAAQAAALEERRLTLRLISTEGQSLFQNVIELPKWIRGEFHGVMRSGGGWEIDSHRLPTQRVAFVVRVPVVEGSRLIIEGRGRSVFELDELSARATELRLSELASIDEGVVEAVQGGSPTNRVDLLIIGDGYTAAQQGLFNSDAATLENDFLSVTPVAEYSNFVNVSTLFSPSAESGADHPPYDASCVGDNPTCCADPTAQNDPLAGTYVNTAFRGRYCAFNIHRLLVVDNPTVLAAASSQDSLS